MAGLLGDDFEGNFNNNLLVELDGGVVFADFLDALFDFDELAVNVVAELLESLGDLEGVD